MINLNADIISLQQSRVEEQASKTEALGKQPEAKPNAESPATVAEISKQALSDINSIISKEDSLIIKTQLAQKAYNYLSDMRLQLNVLRDGLKDSELTNDIQILEMFDNKSNEIIDDVIKTMRNQDFSAYIDTSFMNNILNGLDSLKTLKLSDDNYFVNIENIVSSILTKEEKYKKLTNELNSQTLENAKDFDNLVNNQNSIVNSADIKECILNDSAETLWSVTHNLTPEAVLRLLHG